MKYLLVKKAADSFVSLKDWVWSQRGLKKYTIMPIFNICALMYLLLDIDWVPQTLRCSGEIPLMMFKMNSLWSIQYFICQSMCSLKRTMQSTIKAIQCHRLHWAGHVICFDNSKIPKKILDGTQLQHKPRKHLKDCLKEYFAVCCTEELKGWGTDTCYRYKWRHTIHENTFESNCCM